MSTIQAYSPDARTAPGSESGLRRSMSGVFGLMGVGLAISAGAAFFVAHDPRLMAALFPREGFTPLGWILLLAPLALVIAISTTADRIAPFAARSIFAIYACLMGLSLGSLGYAFTGTSIGGTLAATAVGFAVLGMWGFLTRRDLSVLGVFCGTGLIGIVLMMAINLWVRSERFDFYLAAACIAPFAILTAFDVQRLKRLYHEGDTRSPIAGALTLYLDFLNMFLALLRFTGRRR